MVDVWQIPKCVSGLQGKIEQLAKQTRKPILFLTLVPASIYLFKRNNGNLGTMCEVCSELTTKTSLTFSWCLYCELEQILHIVLVFPLLNLKKYALFVLNFL